MEAIEKEPHPKESSYYLPYHAVLRLDSLPTTIRAVFNASAKARGGKSMSDIIDHGPSLLPDLVGPCCVSEVITPFKRIYRKQESIFIIYYYYDFYYVC